MPRKPKLIIKGSFTRLNPSGEHVGLEFHGEVDTLIGELKEVYEIVHDAEAHGNDGKSRVHIFLQ